MPIESTHFTEDVLRMVNGGRVPLNRWDLGPLHLSPWGWKGYDVWCLVLFINLELGLLSPKLILFRHHLDKCPYIKEGPVS